jgi:hypothetical protein
LVKINIPVEKQVDFAFLKKWNHYPYCVSEDKLSDNSLKGINKRKNK